MKERIFSATAVAFFAASAAFAQVGDAPDPGTGLMGGTWTEATMDAFFQDEEGELALRDEEDIRSNFSGLTPEDRALVHSDCAAFLEGEEQGAGADVETVITTDVPDETWRELCELVADIGI